VSNLPFCYLCGVEFEKKDKSSRDHVPPRALFLSEHRDRPLILRTHTECNVKESVDDEAISSLVSFLHEKHKAFKGERLDIREGIEEGTGQPVAMLYNFNFQGIIWRWIRGFHAALYGEYLNFNSTKEILEPFWKSKVGKNNTRMRKDPLEYEARLVEVIKKNRMTKTLDRIVTCSGKCTYECTWESNAHGRMYCVFSLLIYDWGRLGHTEYQQRGCYGAYLAENVPLTATSATPLEFPVSNQNPFDPFDD